MSPTGAYGTPTAIPADDVNVETNPIQSEIDAIAAVIRALETLPRRDAERVIRYVGDRYGMTVQKSLLHGLVTS